VDGTPVEVEGAVGLADPEVGSIPGADSVDVPVFAGGDGVVDCISGGTAIVEDGEFGTSFCAEVSTTLVLDLPPGDGVGDVVGCAWAAEVIPLIKIRAAAVPTIAFNVRRPPDLFI
jgi:hypothetical protein